MVLMNIDKTQKPTEDVEMHIAHFSSSKGWYIGKCKLYEEKQKINEISNYFCNQFYIMLKPSAMLFVK